MELTIGHTAQEARGRECLSGPRNSGIARERSLSNLVSSSARLHGLYPPPCSLFYARVARGYHDGMAREQRNGVSSGTWLAATVVIVGLLLALVALRFRVFTPPSTRPATTPSTR